MGPFLEGMGSPRRRRPGAGESPEADATDPVRASDRKDPLAVAREVGNREQTEAVLLTLSRAVEQCPVSILITDTDGTIRYVNPHFCRTSGYAAEEVLGRNTRILKSGHHPPEFYRALWRTLAAGREWRGEFRNRRKDGTHYWEEATISPVTDGEGRPTHFVAVKEDVTARKLLQEQFQHSQKMEAVGRLAGGVAHDFNNLLTVITGFAEMAHARVPEGDPARGHLDEVRRASERAASLTRQLLAFSRRQLLQPRVVDLNETIGGMEGMLRRLLGEDVELVLETDPSLHPVLVDPGQVEQAIMNLCVNARDAMPHGGRLVVGTRNREFAPVSSGDWVDAGRGACAVVEVRDQGTGMAPEVRARIFEPFFTTKPSGRGTGLGLAMVYGFVAQSGGTVEVDSAPGAGTAVRLLLPRAIPQEEGSGGGSPVPAEQRGSETILLVEDEPAVAEVARRSLESGGYRVVVASCGEVAARIAADGAIRPDLLLTDVVMPGLNGREVASIVEGLRPGIRVLYMSGYTDDVIGQHGVLEAGIDLLAKPFRPEALRARVREILDRGTARCSPVRLWRKEPPGAKGVPG